MRVRQSFFISSARREKLVSIPIHPLRSPACERECVIWNFNSTPGCVKRQRASGVWRHWAKFRPLDNTIAFIKIATRFIWAQGGTINKSLSGPWFLAAMHFFCETKHTREISGCRNNVLYFLYTRHHCAPVIYSTPYVLRPEYCSEAAHIQEFNLLASASRRFGKWRRKKLDRSRLISIYLAW
jgi:hypothetical protein